MLIADAGAAATASAASAGPASHLHVRVIGTSTALGSDPVDVLGRILDVARLAVDAVLGVDLESGFTGLAIDEFVYSCRAIKPLWAGIDRQVYRSGYVGIL